MTGYKCPTCGTKLFIQLKEYEDDDDEFVRRAILRYLTGDEPYKGSIVRDGENKYRFHLQTYDSPEVDIWISGIAKFSLKYGNPFLEIHYDKKERM